MAEFRFEVVTDEGVILASSGEGELQYDALLESIHIHRRLEKIGFAELVFVCPNMAKDSKTVKAEDAPFAIGTNIVIKAAQVNATNSTLEALFIGKVTRSQLRIKSGMFELKLTLKDHAIGLVRKRKNRLFLEKTDADIVEEIIADDNELLSSGGLDSSIVHEQHMQLWVSDWDTIRGLAHKNGCLLAPQLAESEIRIDFIKLSDFSETGSLAVDGQAIRDFCIQYNGESQYQSVVMDNWSQSDQALAGEQSTDDSTLGFSVYGKTLAASALCWDDLMLEIIDDGSKSEGEPLAMTSGELNVLSACSHTGYLLMDGNNDYLLGDGLSLEKASDAFKGPYLISGLIHDLTSKGWDTRYEFGMKREQLALPLLDHLGASGSGTLGATSQLMIAVVADFKDDPKGEFRVPIKLQRLGAGAEPIWARVAMVEAGGGRGVVFWPEAGDEVVVSFVGSDYRCPVVVGSLFSASSNTVPEGFEPNSENAIRGIVTKNAMKVALDNTEEQIDLIIDDDTNICLQKSTGLTATIAVDYSSTITGAMTVEVTKALSIKASDAVTVASAKDMTIESDAAVTLTGASAVDIKSDASASLEGGSSVDIKAGSAMNIKGAPINLN